MPAVIPLLRAAPFFKGVPDATLERLAARCIPREVGAGFTLFREGEPSHGFYFILEGLVRVYRIVADGREQTLVVEPAGQPVAELPLFEDKLYPSTAVTVCPSRLAFIPRAEFEHAFRTEPEFATAVVRALDRRLRHLVQLLEVTALRDVSSKLALHLAEYAERQGFASGDGTVLDLPRTQDQLASEIGAARESISRAFKQLSRAGLIRRKVGSRLLLSDPTQLRQWARTLDHRQFQAVRPTRAAGLDQR